MSYILNALKKAERDRLREDPKGLDDFAGAQWDPYQPEKNKGSPKVWSIVVVIVFVGLVFGGYSIEQRNSYAVHPNIIEKTNSESSKELGQSKSILKPTNESLSIKAFVMSEEGLEISAGSIKIPDFDIAGHMFIKQGSVSNRLFIGEGSFREGDLLDSTWTLRAINPDSFSIQAGDRLEIVAYR